MPYVTGTSFPYPTYYFRTHFDFAGPVSGASLVLSNFVDDGAIFSLNGAEIYRLRMSPPPTFFNTTAAGYPCASLASSDPCHGNACTVCPDVFAISGNVLTNLVLGDNVLAVEVHNYSLASPDITFGAALSYTQTLPPATAPTITVQPTGQSVSLGGTATFYVLAEGDLPLSFQWRLSGAPILFATNNLLTLTNLQLTNLGPYDVTVSNPSGTIVSKAALLQSNAALRINQVQVQGTNLAISISSQPGLAYMLEYSSNLSGATWTPISTNTANGPVLNLLGPLTPPPNGFFRVRVE
jgi:hypothetical protein